MPLSKHVIDSLFEDEEMFFDGSSLRTVADYQIMETHKEDKISLGEKPSVLWAV